MKKITVFLSDDHTVFREGLRLLLEATDDIDVIGEAENGHRAVREGRQGLRWWLGGRGKNLRF